MGSTFPIERGWVSLNHKGLSNLVGRMIRAHGPDKDQWEGHEKDAHGPVKLTPAELLDALNGVHGAEAQKNFAVAIAGGIPVFPGSEVYDSFASVCLQNGALDHLREVALANVELDGKSLAGIAWQDLLGSVIGRKPEHRLDSRYHGMRNMDARSIELGSLFFAAVSAATKISEEERQAALLMALELNDEHPDIHEILQRGGLSAAVLSRALMTRRLSQDAPAAPAIAEPPTDASRRRRVAL